MRAAVAFGTGVALLLAGCGSERKPLPPACTDGPKYVLRALRAAPDPVRLTDGTLLSECVARALNDSELQQLGFALTPAADALAATATEAAAFQLGYLVGAARRGAGHTNGVHLELVRRLEGTVSFEDPALLDAARRGARAGQASG